MIARAMDLSLLGWPLGLVDGGLIVGLRKILQPPVDSCE